MPSARDRSGGGGRPALASARLHCTPAPPAVEKKNGNNHSSSSDDDDDDEVDHSNDTCNNVVNDGGGDDDGDDEHLWQAYYDELLNYCRIQLEHAPPPGKKKNGSAAGGSGSGSGNLLQDCPIGLLQEWMRLQRALGRGGRLAPHRRRQLEELGFLWGCNDDDVGEQAQARRRPWEAQLRALRRRAPDRCLARWVADVRARWRQNQLTESQKGELRQAGFQLDPWREMLQRYVEWQQRQQQQQQQQANATAATRSQDGDGDGGDDSEEFAALRDWIKQQRRDRRLGRLGRARIRQLEEVQFSWISDAAQRLARRRLPPKPAPANGSGGNNKATTAAGTTKTTVAERNAAAAAAAGPPEDLKDKESTSPPSAKTTTTKAPPRVFQAAPASKDGDGDDKNGTSRSDKIVPSREGQADALSAAPKTAPQATAAAPNDTREKTASEKPKTAAAAAAAAAALPVETPTAPSDAVGWKSAASPDPGDTTATDQAPVPPSAAAPPPTEPEEGEPECDDRAETAALKAAAAVDGSNSSNENNNKPDESKTAATAAGPPKVAAHRLAGNYNGKVPGKTRVPKALVPVDRAGGETSPISNGSETSPSKKVVLRPSQPVTGKRIPKSMTKTTPKSTTGQPKAVLPMQSRKADHGKAGPVENHDKTAGETTMAAPGRGGAGPSETLNLATAASKDSGTVPPSKKTVQTSADSQTIPSEKVSAKAAAAAHSVAKEAEKVQKTTTTTTEQSKNASAVANHTEKVSQSKQTTNKPDDGATARRNVPPIAQTSKAPPVDRTDKEKSDAARAPIAPKDNKRTRKATRSKKSASVGAGSNANKSRNKTKDEGAQREKNQPKAPPVSAETSKPTTQHEAAPVDATESMVSGPIDSEKIECKTIQTPPPSSRLRVPFVPTMKAVAEAMSMLRREERLKKRARRHTESASPPERSTRSKSKGGEPQPKKRRSGSSKGRSVQPDNEKAPASGKPAAKSKKRNSNVHTVVAKILAQPDPPAPTAAAKQFQDKDAADAQTKAATLNENTDTTKNQASLQDASAAVHSSSPTADAMYLGEDHDSVSGDDFLATPEVARLIDDVVEAAVKPDSHPDAVAIHIPSADTDEAMSDDDDEDNEEEHPDAVASSPQAAAPSTFGGAFSSFEQPPGEGETGGVYADLSEYFDQDPEPAYYEHQLEPDYNNKHLLSSALLEGGDDGEDNNEEKEEEPARRRTRSTSTVPPADDDASPPPKKRSRRAAAGSKTKTDAKAGPSSSEKIAEDAASEAVNEEEKDRSKTPMEAVLAVETLAYLEEEGAEEAADSKAPAGNAVEAKNADEDSDRDKKQKAAPHTASTAGGSSSLPAVKHVPVPKPQSARSKIPWDKMFDSLQTYKTAHGDCLVSRAYDRTLSVWIDTQRRAYKAGLINPERKARLESLGFVWDTRLLQDQNWDSMYEELVAYHAKHRTCEISRSDDKYKKLAVWLERNRQSCKRKDRRAKLEALGFEWEKQTRKPRRGSDDERWQDMFEAMSEYKNIYGNCLVPKPFEVYPKLSNWVDKQRNLYRNNMLQGNRMKKLESIGFAFDAAKEQTDERWEYMFAKLLEYKKENGNCKVPRHYKKDPQLGRWVGRNRHRGRTGVLEPERKDRLTAAGFWWGEKQDKYSWDNGIELLKKFHKEHGHANVPVLHRKDYLSRWVKYQRQRDKSNFVTDEERKTLDELGFVWEPTEVDDPSNPKSNEAHNNDDDGDDDDDDDDNQNEECSDLGEEEDKKPSPEELMAAAAAEGETAMV